MTDANRAADFFREYEDFVRTRLIKLDDLPPFTQKVQKFIADLSEPYRAAQLRPHLAFSNISRRQLGDSSKDGHKVSSVVHWVLRSKSVSEGRDCTARQTLNVRSARVAGGT